MNVKQIIKYYTYFYFLTYPFLVIQGQQENNNLNIQASLFDKTALLERVKFLALDSLEGRKTGERGNLIARDYISNQLKKYNVKPFLNGYLQLFNFKSHREKKIYKAANILGVIEGNENPNKYIVISAHYDHVGIIDSVIYNGADDDASGVSATFALIEYLQKHPPKYSVIIALFDAEELGLKGAQYFLKSFPFAKENILLNINLDMLGRNDNNQLYVVGTNLYKQLKPLIDVELPDNFQLLSGHDGTDGKQNWTDSSDHGIFHKAKIPFLYFGVEDHVDYHKPTDDFENIQPEFYIKSVKTIISVFKKVDAIVH